jgi:acyl-CoA synthetase (AMP-forming)/AMP-acid ligase II
VIDPEKIWLAGGGWSEPVTYGRLMADLARADETPGEATCVGEVLLAVTRALYHGRRIAPRELSFGGEGRACSAPPAAGASAAALHAIWSRLQREPAGEVVLETSGTTGRPVPVSHRLPTLSRAVVTATRHADDVWGLAFHPAHIAGVQVYLQGLANANTMVSLWGLESGEMMARCRAWRVTHLSATPTFYRTQLTGEPLPEVRAVAVGGEPVDETLIRRLRWFFPRARIRNIYAMTEAGTLLTSEGVDFVLPAGPDAPLKIEGGTLWVHRRLLASFAGAGEWFDTGDEVEIVGTDPARFVIIGRRSGWINVGGEKVNPHEVEQVLCGHPAISAARVFARKNSVTGALLAAEVVAASPTGEAELRDYLSRSLPAAKIPRIIRLVDRLASTDTGKLLRQG